MIKNTGTWNNKSLTIEFVLEVELFVFQLRVSNAK